MKEDAGSASFAGKSFDCLVRVVSRVHQSLAFPKVLLWFVFVMYGLFIFMVKWKEAY